MLNLLYTITSTAVTAFFAVLVWYLLDQGAPNMAVTVSILWLSFMVIFTTIAEKEKRGSESTL